MPATLRPSEVARALNISRFTVYALIHRGELPAIRVGGQYRIEASALAKFREAGRLGAHAPIAAEFVLRGAGVVRALAAPGDLLALPTTTLEAMHGARVGLQRHRYRGVLLHTLLVHHGLVTEAPLPGKGSRGCSDVVRSIVIARGRDGRAAVLSLAEIAPEYGRVPALVAWERDGAPLGEEGPIQLVVPSDGLGGRGIHGLESIEVRTIE
ncbi:MAG: excisionase family DNA-binding protein [Chloroflexota bacterium]|nr:excisionase family DNA-binding protein [Dehalococcoidia bacterium]MDW8255260.1 excisionase family DNA-binding protein [Chloroflexota bacterium]